MNQPQFDVFLCHNSKDKPEVIEIANELKNRGLKPWLDKWELRPGLSWQILLEEQIEQIKSAAVFVGSSGFGPWQNQEMRAFLSEFVERECFVIPVLLRNTPDKPKLPIFLKGNTWVDFRTDPDAMEHLIWGITGNKPIEQRPPTNPVILTQSSEQPTPTNPVILNDDLSSEKGVDYTNLRDLLVAKNWKEADRETYLVMIRAVGKKDNGWFTTKELLNFPCTDLRTIDRLWVKYSNGRFGFSVQKEIYLSVGGKADGKYDSEAFDNFGDRVGWRVEKIKKREGIWKSLWKEELYIEDRFEVTYDTYSPKGHLPCVFWIDVIHHNDCFSGIDWCLFEEFLAGFVGFGCLLFFTLLSHPDL